MRGIHRPSVNSPAQRPVTRSFDVFFDLRLNKRLSKQSWGWSFETPWRPFWRHCNDTKQFAIEYVMMDIMSGCNTLRYLKVVVGVMYFVSDSSYVQPCWWRTCETSKFLSRLPYNGCNLINLSWLSDTRILNSLGIGHCYLIFIILHVLPAIPCRPFVTYKAWTEGINGSNSHNL